MGEMEAAEQYLLKSLNLHQDQFRSLQALGQLAFRKGNYGEAARRFREAVEKGGASDTTFFNLGTAHWKGRKNRLAEEAFLRCLEMNPRRLEALRSLSELYREGKEYEKAVDCLKKALFLDPRSIDARLSLSEIYFRCRELENLVEQCDHLLGGLGLPSNFVINDFGDLGSLYGRIGDELRVLGRNELSLAAYQISFLISPSSEVLEKMVRLNPSPDLLKGCVEKAAEALQFHGQASEDLKNLSRNICLPPA